MNNHFSNPNGNPKQYLWKWPSSSRHYRAAIQGLGLEASNAKDHDWLFKSFQSSESYIIKCPNYQRIPKNPETYPMSSLTLSLSWAPWLTCNSRLKFALQQRLAEILHLMPGSCLCLRCCLKVQLIYGGDSWPNAEGHVEMVWKSMKQHGLTRMCFGWKPAVFSFAKYAIYPWHTWMSLRFAFDWRAWRGSLSMLQQRVATCSNQIHPNTHCIDIASRYNIIAISWWNMMEYGSHTWQQGLLAATGPESPSVQLCGWQHWPLVALDRSDGHVGLTAKLLWHSSRSRSDAELAVPCCAYDILWFLSFQPGW